MKKVRNFVDMAKSMNGKTYKILLIDLKTLKNEEIEVLGVLIKTTNLRRNMYGDGFDYTGRFLAQDDFDVKNTSQTLIDGGDKYSLELEYDFQEKGKNKLINNFRHRSFLIKKVR